MELIKGRLIANEGHDDPNHTQAHRQPDHVDERGRLVSQQKSIRYFYVIEQHHGVLWHKSTANNNTTNNKNL